jgi:hypothetical protein
VKNLVCGLINHAGVVCLSVYIFVVVAREVNHASDDELPRLLLLLLPFLFEWLVGRINVGGLFVLEQIIINKLSKNKLFVYAPASERSKSKKSIACLCCDTSGAGTGLLAASAHARTRAARIHT